MKPSQVPPPPIARTRTAAAQHQAGPRASVGGTPTKPGQPHWPDVTASSTYVSNATSDPSATDELADLDDTEVAGRGRLWDDIKINTHVEWRLFWITSMLGVIPWWIFALQLFPIWQLWCGAALTGLFSCVMGPIARRQIAWDRRTPPHSVPGTLRTPAGVVALVRSGIAVPCYATATGFDMAATFFCAAITALIGIGIVLIAEVGSIDNPNT